MTGLDVKVNEGLGAAMMYGAGARKARALLSPKLSELLQLLAIERSFHQHANERRLIDAPPLAKPLHAGAVLDIALIPDPPLRS